MSIDVNYDGNLIPYYVRQFYKRQSRKLGMLYVKISAPKHKLANTILFSNLKITLMSRINERFTPPKLVRKMANKDIIMSITTR